MKVFVLEYTNGLDSDIVGVGDSIISALDKFDSEVPNVEIEDYEQMSSTERMWEFTDGTRLYLTEFEVITDG